MEQQRAFAREGLLQRVAPFAGAALVPFVVGPAFGGQYTDPAFVGAVALTFAVIGLALFFPWERFPCCVEGFVPLAYFGVVALLRDSGGGGQSGYATLVLLPLLWLALYGSRLQLVAGLVGLAATLVLPIVLVGAPTYPPSEWRRAIIWVGVAPIVGFAVHGLVRKVREQAWESDRRAEALDEARLKLAEQNERLVELDRMKDDFVALVSHELRTPLTSISGYVETLLDGSPGPLTETQQSFLEVVDRNADVLLRRVNDLLFIAQVDAGQFSLDVGEVDVAAVVDEAAERARPLAEAGGVAVRVSVAPTGSVAGDRARLGQLVDNLVSNAIKFTPEGGTVELRARGRGDEVLLEIRDTGVGIAADEIPRLFTRFFRTRGAAEMAAPGTGLGLAIARTIVEAHDGSIEVESDLGAGTVFRVRLPLAAPVEAAA